MKGVEQPPQFHPEGDVWIHTLVLLEKLPAGVSSTLAWGALLHDVGKPATFTAPKSAEDRIRFDRHVEVGMKIAEEICRRFRFSNEDMEQVVALVENHMKFKDVGQMRASTLKRFVRLNQFDEHLELHRLDCLSCHGLLDNYEFLRRFIEETFRRALLRSPNCGEAISADREARPCRSRILRRKPGSSRLAALWKKRRGTYPTSLAQRWRPEDVCDRHGAHRPE